MLRSSKKSLSGIRKIVRRNRLANVSAGKVCLNDVLNFIGSAGGRELGIIDTVVMENVWGLFGVLSMADIPAGMYERRGRAEDFQRCRSCKLPQQVTPKEERRVA